jgi:hypothetical protein
MQSSLGEPQREFVIGDVYSQHLLLARRATSPDQSPYRRLADYELSVRSALLQIGTWQPQEAGLCALGHLLQLGSLAELQCEHCSHAAIVRKRESLDRIGDIVHPTPARGEAQQLAKTTGAGKAEGEQGATASEAGLADVLDEFRERNCGE